MPGAFVVTVTQTDTCPSPPPPPLSRGSSFQNSCDRPTDDFPFFQTGIVLQVNSRSFISVTDRFSPFPSFFPRGTAAVGKRETIPGENLDMPLNGPSPFPLRSSSTDGNVGRTTAICFWGSI